MRARTGSIALDRVSQVVLGIVVALLVSTFVFPIARGLRLRDGLAQEFLVLGAFFEDDPARIWRSALRETWRQVREDALRRLCATTMRCLEAARNEPSGGPGWREGLGMLAQFGRSLFDALVALEFAVRDSHDDKYVEQLEPALGRLAGGHSQRLSLSRQLHSSSGAFMCRRWVSIWKKTLRSWRRGWPQCGTQASQFSQAEILRAYAVQLHLKQIARLLRAARVETSRAIGEAAKCS